MFRSFLFLFLSVSVFAVSQTPQEPGHFVVDLPPQWQESKVRVLIEGAQVPGNIALKLRVTAVQQDKKEISLGSIGVEAIGPGKSELRTVRTLRLDVTRALQRFLANQPSPKKIELRVQPVDARANPISDLTWSVKSVRLEALPKK